MDVLWFLQQRTEFIRFYYETSAQTWLEIKRKIECGEPPFNDPPYDESGEPPFMIEWSQAEDGLTILGRSAAELPNMARALVEASGPDVRQTFLQETVEPYIPIKIEP